MPQGGSFEVVALDCEMVGVRGSAYNPDDPATIENALCRVSVIRLDDVSESFETMLDLWVEVDEDVVDWRTPITGVNAVSFRSRKRHPFHQVRRQVQDWIENRILVGHALWNDLEVLRLEHPQELIRDTAEILELRPEWRQKLMPSLSLLMRHWFHEEMHDGVHDSVQDAWAALRLYQLVQQRMPPQAHSVEMLGYHGRDQQQVFPGYGRVDIRMTSICGEVGGPAEAVPLSGSRRTTEASDSAGSPEGFSEPESEVEVVEPVAVQELGKGVAAELLGEAGQAHAGEERQVVPQLPLLDEADRKWACFACTFENSDFLDYCEICDEKRKDADDFPLPGWGRRSFAAALTQPSPVPLSRTTAFPGAVPPPPPPPPPTNAPRSRPAPGVDQRQPPASAAPRPAPPRAPPVAVTAPAEVSAAPARLVVGDKISALFYGEWHPGTLRQIRDDGQVEVLWEAEWSVSVLPAENVVPASPPPPPLTAPPPPPPPQTTRSGTAVPVPARPVGNWTSVGPRRS